jgi:hypothetical protein
VVPFAAVFIGTIPKDRFSPGKPVVDVAVYPVSGSPVIDVPNQVRAAGVAAVVTVVAVFPLLVT